MGQGVLTLSAARAANNWRPRRDVHRVVGQTGAFLVHHPLDDDAASPLAGTPVPQLALARAIDVRAIDDEAAIARLLAAPPR